MFEARKKQTIDKAKVENEKDENVNAQVIAMRAIEACQDYLLSSVQQYGLALQLGQKHVYQALPRLLSTWLEFTSQAEECGDHRGTSCAG